MSNFFKSFVTGFAATAAGPQSGLLGTSTPLGRMLKDGTQDDFNKYLSARQGAVKGEYDAYKTKFDAFESQAKTLIDIIGDNAIDTETHLTSQEAAARLMKGKTTAGVDKLIADFSEHRKEGTNINAYSRQGKEFETLQKVLDDVCKMPGDFILDGEICMMDERGNEDFQGIMKQIKRKNHTIYNPKYIVFDYLTLEEFDNKVGSRKLSDRLSELITQSWGVDTTLEVLEQYGMEDDESLSDMIDEAEYQGYEGVMLRKNTGYEGKRTKNLLKVKKFFDAEYIVKSIENSTHRVIVGGLEVEEEMLSNVVIEHKGCDVGVGSGFNQEERRLYFKNPELIIGKTITVQYFEETTNQDGCHSLRFPVVKHVFENGRNV